MEVLDVLCTVHPAQDFEMRDQMAGTAFLAAVLVLGVDRAENPPVGPAASVKASGSLFVLEPGSGMPTVAIPDGSVVIGFGAKPGRAFGAIELSGGSSPASAHTKQVAIERIRNQAKRLGIVISNFSVF